MNFPEAGLGQVQRLRYPAISTDDPLPAWPALQLESLPESSRPPYLPTSARILLQVVLGQREAQISERFHLPWRAQADRLLELLDGRSVVFAVQIDHSQCRMRHREQHFFCGLD